jgi:phage baseplate assembly protein W
VEGNKVAVSTGNEGIVLATDVSEPQLYNGMAFPFGGTVLSTFGPKRDEDVIKTSIEMILFTRANERVMIPEFGSDVESLLFEPNDDFLAVILRGATEEAINIWEPRAQAGPVEIEMGEQTVTVRIPLVILKPDGPREVNFNIELERETLYNIPFPGR